MSQIEKCPECGDKVRKSAMRKQLPTGEYVPARIYCFCGWEPEEQLQEAAEKQRLYEEAREARKLPCPKCGTDVREWGEPQTAHIGRVVAYSLKDKDRFIFGSSGEAAIRESVSSALGTCGACGFRGFADWTGRHDDGRPIAWLPQR